MLFFASVAYAFDPGNGFTVYTGGPTNNAFWNDQDGEWQIYNWFNDDWIANAPESVIEIDDWTILAPDGQIYYLELEYDEEGETWWEVWVESGEYCVVVAP